MSEYYVYAYLNPLEEGIYSSSIVSFFAKPFYIFVWNSTAVFLPTDNSFKTKLIVEK